MKGTLCLFVNFATGIQRNLDKTEFQENILNFMKDFFEVKSETIFNGGFATQEVHVEGQFARNVNAIHINFQIEIDDEKVPDKEFGKKLIKFIEDFCYQNYKMTGNLQWSWNIQRH